MKFAILSDLHLEFSSFQPGRLDVDAVILAGDIWTGDKAVEWAKTTFGDLPVLYVPGNHEFYGDNVSTLPAKLREAAADSNVTMLMRNELAMGDVRILGCTLWTDYRLFADRGNATSRAAMDAANQYLTDHKKIRHGAEYGRFRPLHALQLHDLDKQFLRERLAQPWAGKTVVITHHAPSARSIAPKFEADDLTPCYASNLETLMPGVDLWVHGHSHYAVDYQVGNTRVVCNPRGYESYSGREHTGWNQQLVIEV